MTRKCCVPGCTNRKDAWGNSGRSLFNIGSLPDDVLAQLGLGASTERPKHLLACEDHFATQSIVRNGSHLQLCNDPVVIDHTAAVHEAMDAEEIVSEDPDKRLKAPVINKETETESEAISLESASQRLIDPASPNVHRKFVPNRPKLADSKDREIAMLKDKNAVIRRVANQCRYKLLILQNSLSSLESIVNAFTNQGSSASLVSRQDTLVLSIENKSTIQNKVAVKRVGSTTTRPASISNQSSKYARTQVTCRSAGRQLSSTTNIQRYFPLDMKKKPLPIKSFMDLNDYELGMRDELVFDSVKKIVLEKTVPFEQLPSAMNAVLNTIISPEVQKQLKTLLAKESGLKNFVRLFHAVVTEMCPSQPVGEACIRSFLTDPTDDKPDPPPGQAASSKSYVKENSQNEGTVVWLQEVADDEKEMELEEHIFEEKCGQSIVYLEQEAHHDALAIDLKTEEE